MDYPLKTLMEMRTQQRDVAEQAYQVALREQEANQLVVKEARHRMNASEEDFQKARSMTKGLRHSTFTMTELTLHRAYEVAMKHEVVLAKERLEHTQRMLDAHQKIVTEHRRIFEDTQKELMAVEKHLENWKREQKIDRERREADQLDEVAMRVWRIS